MPRRIVDAGGSQLIVGARVSTCASDRNELVVDIAAIAAGLGGPETVLADNGYANGAQVAALEARGVEALVATACRGPAAAPRLPPDRGRDGGEGSQGRVAPGDGDQAR